MIDQGFYLAGRDIAERAGVLDAAYVTEDGRFVLDSQALKYIRLTPDEFVTGLQGIEKIGYEEAKSLIAANGYRHLPDMEAGGGGREGENEGNENGKEE